MKFIKKLTICLSLLLVVVVCPVLLTACNNDKKETEGKQIGKALDAVVEFMQDQPEADTKFDGEGFYILCMKAVSKSSQYSTSYNTAKGTAKALKGTASYNFENIPTPIKNISAIFSFEINWNNIKVEMADYAEPTQYYSIDVDYDFDKDELVSFEWIFYAGQDDQMVNFNSFKYEDGVLKEIDNASAEYASLISSTQTKADALENAPNMSEVFDFSEELVTVYNKYASAGHKMQVAQVAK